MAKVTYISPNGSSQSIDVPAGQSVMQAAVSNGIEGIVGECGGNAMCATCHVYVDPTSAASLPLRSMVENEMLEFAACEATEMSRLSCQLISDDNLDGLVVRLPEEQL